MSNHTQKMFIQAILGLWAGIAPALGGPKAAQFRKLIGLQPQSFMCYVTHFGGATVLYSSM